MFSYLDAFDHICSKVTPMEVVTLVNRMFLTFDKLSEKHDVYKVKLWTQKNWFVHICSLQIGRKNVKTEESKSGAKMVNATFTKKQGVYMFMWCLPFLPQIYSLNFTILRHICRKQICTNPFFRPATGSVPYRLRNWKRQGKNYWILCKLKMIYT